MKLSSKAGSTSLCCARAACRSEGFWGAAVPLHLTPWARYFSCELLGQRGAEWMQGKLQSTWCNTSFLPCFGPITPKSNRNKRLPPLEATSASSAALWAFPHPYLNSFEECWGW